MCRHYKRAVKHLVLNIAHLEPGNMFKSVKFSLNFILQSDALIRNTLKRTLGTHSLHSVYKEPFQFPEKKRYIYNVNNIK